MIRNPDVPLSFSGSPGVPTVAKAERSSQTFILHLVLWSMYSRMIRTSCTRVRIKAPNAKDPTWYLEPGHLVGYSCNSLHFLHESLDCGENARLQLSDELFRNLQNLDLNRPLGSCRSPSQHVGRFRLRRDVRDIRFFDSLI